MNRKYIAAGVAVLACSGWSWTTAAASSDLPDVVRTQVGGVTASLVGDRLEVAVPETPLQGVKIVDERTSQTLGSATSLPFRGDLKPGTSASWLLVTTGATPGVLAKVIAMNPREESALPGVIAVLTAAGTSLDWGDVEGVDQWSLNDKPVVGSRAELQHRLNDPDLRVDVAGLTQIGETWTQLTSGLTLVAPASAPATGADNSTSTSNTASGTSGAGPIGGGSIVTTVASQVVYENYIPNQYIDAPDSDFIPYDCESGDGSDYWYGGDNRGLAYNHPRYRTLVRATYDWRTRAKTSMTDVSSSKRYVRNRDGTFTYESSRSAPQDSVMMFPTSNDGSKAMGAASSNSGNPYCSAKNNINYRQFHDLYSTGGYYIEGEHDRMPNHHTYVRQFRSDQTVANVEVFHHQLRDPKCLNEYYGTRFCPDQQYQYSA